MSLPERAQGSAEPMTQVLARIRAELDEVARRIDHNQATIARSTWAAGAGDADYVRAMQDADLSAQRIAGVAEFLRALADASSPQWRIDTAPATDTLKLAELIRSIGGVCGDADSDKETESGEIDLF